MPEKITIVKLGRKQQPSKYKQGETYTITTVMDDKNRKLTAMGKWSDNWKIGDVIEANVENKKWTDKDGFEQTSLALKNPVQSTFQSFKKNTLIDAYHIAAALAPVVYSAKKKVVMEDIDKLAEYVKGKIDATTTQPLAAPASDNVPTMDVNAPVKTEKTVSTEDNDLEIEDADDNLPF